MKLKKVLLDYIQPLRIQNDKKILKGIVTSAKTTKLLLFKLQESLNTLFMKKL